MTIYVDAEGAAAVWAKALPGLVGRGNPLAQGVHLSARRSPGEGAVAILAVIGRDATSDVSDDARLSFAVSGIGTGGGRRVAEKAARALAEQLAALQRTPVTVTTPDGAAVRLLGADLISGPTYAGDLGGEVTYRVDATLRCQAA